jgi:uncharacterized protein (TIGR03435 family)
MSDLKRSLYGAIVRLHPADFRNRFGREMTLDFVDAQQSHGFGALCCDALLSLGRQWAVCTLPEEEEPAPQHALLTGHYIAVRLSCLTWIDLARATLLFGLLVAAAGLIPSSRAKAANNTEPLHQASSGSLAGAGSQRFPAAAKTASGTLPSNVSGAAFGCTIAGPTQSTQPELLLFHPSGALPSYEVATIKPLDPEAASGQVKLPSGVSLSPLSIRRYIMDAYGAIYPAQVVGGPDWLHKDTYKVNGKAPDDLNAALQKMTREDRINQIRMMQQCLLADRFHLQAHFETRILPVYELVPAKGGLKIAEVPAPPERKPGNPPMLPHPSDPLPPGTLMSISDSSGLRVLKGRAIKMDLLARTIGYEVGDRPIVDHTGFTGSFDITGVKWEPLRDALVANGPDAPSLTRAIEQELGIRLVPARDPIEVLVIDHVDRPSEN